MFYNEGLQFSRFIEKLEKSWYKKKNFLKMVNVFSKKPYFFVEIPVFRQKVNNIALKYLRT